MATDAALSSQLKTVKKLSWMCFNKRTKTTESEGSWLRVHFCHPLTTWPLLAMLSPLCHHGQQLVMADTSHALAIATMLYLGI